MNAGSQEHSPKLITAQMSADLTYLQDYFDTRAAGLSITDTLNASKNNDQLLYIICKCNNLLSKI